MDSTFEEMVAKLSEGDLADAAKEALESEGGPEEGELPEDDSAAGDDESDADGDYSGGEDDGDEPELDEEFDEDGDEPEADDEIEEQGEAEAQPDPRDVKIAQLENHLAQLTQYIQAQAGQSAQAAAPAEPPQETIKPDVRRALEILAAPTEGAQEEFSRLPASAREEAAGLVRKFLPAAIEESLDPQARIRNLAPVVEQVVNQVVSPLYQRLQEYEAEKLMERHQDVFSNETSARRIGEILNRIPSGSMKDRLDWAVKLYRAEESKGAVEKRAQKVEQRERQQKANKARRRRGGGKGRRTGKRKQPELKSADDSLMGHFQKLLEQEQGD